MMNLKMNFHIFASECGNSIFRRHPQMILVGFAETVVDAASLQQCLDNCLNSKHWEMQDLEAYTGEKFILFEGQQLYGFHCSSGMFYFEEPQLNCILNTEVWICDFGKCPPILQYSKRIGTVSRICSPPKHRIWLTILKRVSRCGLWWNDKKTKLMN